MAVTVACRRDTLESSRHRSPVRSRPRITSPRMGTRATSTPWCVATSTAPSALAAAAPHLQDDGGRLTEGHLPTRAHQRGRAHPARVDQRAGPRARVDDEQASVTGLDQGVSPRHRRSVSRSSPPALDPPRRARQPAGQSRIRTGHESQQQSPAHRHLSQCRHDGVSHRWSPSTPRPSLKAIPIARRRSRRPDEAPLPLCRIPSGPCCARLRTGLPADAPGGRVGGVAHVAHGSACLAL